MPVDRTPVIRRIRYAGRPGWSVRLGDSTTEGPGLFGTLAIAILFYVEDRWEARRAR